MIRIHFYTLLGFTVALNGCFKMDVVHSGAESVRGKTSKTSLVQAVTTETGAVSAVFSAQSTTTQILSAAANEAVGGTVVALPPGSLSIDTTIVIEEAASIATETMSAELGISAVMEHTGTPVSVQPDVPMDAKQPFVLSMPLPILTLAGSDWSNLIVVYKVKIAADGVTMAGVIPRDEITVENGVAKISVSNFGAFQTALTDVPVEKKKVETKSEIVTKQMVAELPPMSISSRTPFIAKENDTVVISGKNFRPGMMLALGGKKVANIQVVSDSKASFVAPKLDSMGLTRLNAEQDGVSQAVSMFYSGSGELPVISEAESEVCAGKKYYGINGDIKTGTKSCISSADLANLTPANLKSGVTILGVTGTVPPAPIACAADGEINCVASINFPAVDKGALSPTQILAGATVAGVSGTYVAPVATPLADCAADGATNCKANASFKAAAVQGAAAKIVSGQSLAGVTGTAGARPVDCSTDGESNCVAISSFRALSVSSLTANLGKIHSSVSVGGQFGTMPSCGSDGGTECLANSSYPAMQVSGASTKILSGQSLGGVFGSGLGRPADCATDGDTGCVANANFPAIDKPYLIANTSKIRSSLVIGGLAGSLEDCTSDGANGCVAVGPTFAAALLTGANAKIATGQSLAGVAGAAPVRPADCASDGETQCVAVLNFAAADASISAPKIVSGQVVAGITGTAPGGRPADCISDGEQGCVTVPAYPAMEFAGAAAKIASGLTLGAVAGTAAARPADCASDGELSCVTVSAFPAVDKIGVLQPNALKMRSSLTVAGVTGTLANCSTDGSSNCVAVSGFPAANTSGAASKIMQGQTLAGIGGIAQPKPANCSFDGQTDCVAVGSFPAANLANVTPGNIRNGVTIASIAGNFPSATYPLSGADGTPDLESSTFASKMRSSASFEYFTSAGVRYVNSGDADIQAMNLKNPVDIFGAIGSIPTCTADNQTGCLTTPTYRSADTMSFGGWDIRMGKTVAGIAGQFFLPTNLANSSLFNRSSGLGSTPSIDAYDSIDDYANGTMFPTSPLPLPHSSPSLSHWFRDPVSDSNANIACDGAEECVYVDKISGRAWARPDGTPNTWDLSINNCENKVYGTYSDWRMPTQKELMQAYISGIWSLKDTAKLNLMNNPFWAATSDSTSNTQAYLVELSKGEIIFEAKGMNNAFICVR